MAGASAPAAFRLRGILIASACPRPQPSTPSFPSRFSQCSVLGRPRKDSSFSVLSTGPISSPSSTMEASGAASEQELALGMDAATKQEYASQAKLLQEFINTPSIDKAWFFKSDSTNSSRAMFSMSQPNLLANKRRKFVVSSHVFKPSKDSADFQWSPFPVEMPGVSAVVPSPLGSKLLLVRNAENDSPTKLEIWGSSQLEKEINIPQSVHGSIYTDGWFEGISWNREETFVAYVAEEPPQPKPLFSDKGYKVESSSDKDCGSWKGLGDFEEDWGETYSKKRRPSLFVADIHSGEIRHIEGIARSLSVGQVVWAPFSSNGTCNYLVFVGWSSETGFQKTPRKLGIKYCYNRPCALYAIRVPFQKQNDEVLLDSNKTNNTSSVIKLSDGLSSAFFPRFSPDGKYLVFVSAKSAADSGTHWATNSLHKIDWPSDENLEQHINVADVVPIVMCPEDGCFPGLYCSEVLSYPWLSDGHTMIISSAWRSTEVILSVNIMSREVSRVSPQDSNYSWKVLALDGDNVLAVSSSPISPLQIHYAFWPCQMEQSSSWVWIEVSSPFSKSSDKIRSLLSDHKFDILKIPVCNPSSDIPKGGKNPFEAIFVSSKDSASNPTIVMLHGGPHSVTLSGYSKSLAFLSSLGYNLLMVNYRGSLGFGEEALQSLPGKIGSQDVQDVLTALDYVIEKGLIDASKVAVLGGSHGGFLTTHLVGQAPDRFVVAAARNPVCNLSLMVGTTDIPDWCYVEAYGKEGKNHFSEAPSPAYLSLFYEKSPIAHISKVKAPILFLLGAQDLRVPFSNGLQYARTLKERGRDVKVIIFPEDVHAIERPQSDFESFLNIGVWFNKYLHK